MDKCLHCHNSPRMKLLLTFGPLSILLYYVSRNNVRITTTWLLQGLCSISSFPYPISIKTWVKIFTFSSENLFLQVQYPARLGHRWLMNSIMKKPIIIHGTLFNYVFISMIYVLVMLALNLSKLLIHLPGFGSKDWIFLFEQQGKSRCRHL